MDYLPVIFMSHYFRVQKLNLLGINMLLNMAESFAITCTVSSFLCLSTGLQCSSCMT